MINWICIGLILGTLSGICEIKSKNKQLNKLVITISVLIILASSTILIYANVTGNKDFLSKKDKYKNIAIEYIEEGSRDYLQYMKLVDTLVNDSYDKEVTVKLKYRFTEGMNVSYLKYEVIIDKDTKQIVGVNKF